MVSAPLRPQIGELDWVWEAWIDLSTCRSIGMAEGPIPWTAADRYSERHGLTEEEFELLWHCIQHLEHVRREHFEQKREREKRQHGNQKRTSRR